MKQDRRVENALAIEVEHPAAGRTVVVFKGEHDLTQVQALRTLLSELVTENELVVADFSRAVFVDAATITVLLQTKREAEESQRRFRVQMGTECVVYRVFEVAGVLSVLECAPSRQEALDEGSHGNA